MATTLTPEEQEHVRAFDSVVLSTCFEEEFLDIICRLDARVGELDADNLGLTGAYTLATKENGDIKAREARLRAALEAARNTICALLNPTGIPLGLQEIDAALAEPAG